MFITLPIFSFFTYDFVWYQKEAEGGVLGVEEVEEEVVKVEWVPDRPEDEVVAEVVL